MLLSSSRPVSPPTALLLAVLAPGLAMGSPVHKPSDRLEADPGRCTSALSRFSNAGSALGYALRAQRSGFIGSKGHDQLDVTCTDGLVAVDLIEKGGSRVSIHFDPGLGGSFALELVGEYPEVGTVSQTAIVDDPATDPMTGFLAFTADTRSGAAFVEYDLAGALLSEGGDANIVNDRFASVLTASTAWSDAHALALALAGIETERDVNMLAVAVPTPRSHGIKKSILGQAMTCGTATITCTVAAYGYTPAAGSCINAVSACALAVACAIISCAD
jgi:hypothetical protein